MALLNVVCIGTGLAGTSAIEALANSLPSSHRIVAVAPVPGYWPIAALRAAVVPGWEDKPIARLTNIFPKGSRHVILEGTSVVELRKNSVVVDKAHPELGFDGTEIEFDKCIIATGSSYPFPCRPLAGSSASDLVDQLRSVQAQVASSSSILVIGGGPVGIEVAGEVAEYYNGKNGREKKTVTLVHAGERFIAEEGFKPKLGKNLKSQLEVLGVKVVMGKRVDAQGLPTGAVEGGAREFKLDDGETVTADFIFLAFGNTPNTSLLSAFDPSTLDASHRVKVQPSLQLTGYDNLFAIGDITDIPESKLFAHAQNHGPVVAKNIVALIKTGHQDPAGLKSYKAGGRMIAVSVGFNGGAGQMFGWSLGPWMVAFVKSKTLFVDNFKKLYHV
ncbi:SPOSA6832_02334, partial [Sporobolomyces salmonicolor]